MSSGTWVLIWVLLVIAAIGVFVLIGVHLFRKLQTAMTQAQATTVLFEEFERALDQAPEPTMPAPLAVGAGLTERARWTRQRRENRIRRAQRKAVRRRATLARWREIPIPPAKQ